MSISSPRDPAASEADRLLRVHDERRLQQFRKLTEVSRALTYTVSLDEVLQLVVQRASELLESAKAVLMLTNEDGLLSVRASFGLEGKVTDRFREPMDETLIRRLQGLLEIQADRFLGVPLVVGGQVTGILAVALTQNLKATNEHEWLLSALADQAAVALEKTRLDENAEFRERLIGIVSHDLRNPIAAIALATTILLQRDTLDAASVKTVVRIKSAADRAGRLIHDLLDYTQAHLGGGIRIKRAPTDLEAVVRQVTEELEPLNPERIVVSHVGHCIGNWDAERLAQVVGNLLTNSLHYSPHGSPVRLTTTAHEDEVLLSVHNDGPPIASDRLADLFEPLQRATSELTSANRSVGLGLYIVRQVVEAHGGSVGVQSTAKEGTTFTVRLPREVLTAGRLPV